jgi:hypothetical protein
MPIRVLPNGHCHSCPQPGRHQSERLVVIDRTGWSSSIGGGGRHQSESVVAINRCAQVISSWQRRRSTLDHLSVTAAPSVVFRIWSSACQILALP